MRHFLIRWFITTMGVVVAASLVPGIGYDTVNALVLTALLLGILNAFIRPILLLLSAPLILLTLGLFILVINGLMLWWAQGLVPGFHVESYGSAFWGAIVISIISWFLSAFFRDSHGKVHVITHHPRVKRVSGRVIEPDERRLP